MKAWLSCPCCHWMKRNNSPYTVHFSKFSPSTNWVVEGLRVDSAEMLFQSFRMKLAVLAWAGMSTLWCRPSSISSAVYGVAHHPRCPEEWFWKGCCGIWHARTMQFPSLGSCQKRFLWTHKEVDIAPHPVVGLVFQAGSADSRTLIILTQISESVDRSYPWLINDFCAE